MTGPMTAVALSRVVQCNGHIHIITELSAAYECVFFCACLETIHKMFYLEVYTKRVEM